MFDDQGKLFNSGWGSTVCGQFCTHESPSFTTASFGHLALWVADFSSNGGQYIVDELHIYNHSATDIYMDFEAHTLAAVAPETLFNTIAVNYGSALGLGNACNPVLDRRLLGMGWRANSTSFSTDQGNICIPAGKSHSMRELSVMLQEVNDTKALTYQVLQMNFSSASGTIAANDVTVNGHGRYVIAN